MYKRDWHHVRERILGRDNYKCSKCGSGENLCVHHKDRVKENDNEGNLITLCSSCHFEEHKRDGWGIRVKCSKRRSKNTIIDKETGIISGQREIRKMGNSYYINIPREFLDKHGLGEGDQLTFGANHLLKYMPQAEK